MLTWMEHSSSAEKSIMVIGALVNLVIVYRFREKKTESVLGFCYLMENSGSTCVNLVGKNNKVVN